MGGECVCISRRRESGIDFYVSNLPMEKYGRDNIKGSASGVVVQE